ncbi:MAG: serine/threonine-protein kinase, partial [Planctomycetaceae bacterium]
MIPNDQPETPGAAKPFSASGGSRPPEAPPQAPADTAGPDDTESVPNPPDGKDSGSAAAEATLPPQSVPQVPSDECATLPPRSRVDTDAPQSRSGIQRVNEAACNRLEKSRFDGDPLSIETCLEHVPEPERADTTEELVCIEMEFLWKQSVSASQGEDTSDADSSDTESSAPTSLEDYLKRFPQLDTPQRMERLVSEEIACRLQIHAAIDPDNYRQRFPDLIADNSWVQQRVDAIQRLGTSGRRSSSERTVTPWQTADADAAPGLRNFGDYKLLQEIARGGMGVVYKARQTKLNRVVALKMILSGQLASQADVQRFYVEAEAAASLDHPGIVPIYEIGEHDEQHFFSMGFIDGDSLESQVKNGPLPPREAAVVTQRVSEAIAYAHARSVIHRDLKPANILIDSGGEPKVTDFGLAKKTDSDSGLTGTGQILGTPGYMPPEQASGETDTIGPAADIYSLGAILYALLTGRPPFQLATAIDTLVAVLEQEPVAPRQLNPALDADLETICLKCLQKDIKRRYATADELVAELGRYLNGEPIHARPIGRAERTWRWCKRKPALAGLSALAGLMLLTLGIGGPLVAYQFKTALSAQLQAERERRVVQARALRQATPQAAATILKELDLQSGDVQEALRRQLSDSSLPANETNRVRLGLLKSDREQLEPIVEFVLSESGRRLKPEELLLIRG